MLKNSNSINGFKANIATNIFLFVILYIKYVLVKNIIKDDSLNIYKDNILCIVPFKSKELFEKLKFYNNLYISYNNSLERLNALTISSNVLYINDLKEGEKILLIDDVVSTGGTLISTLNALKELNIDIKAAVAVIEKGEGKKLVEKETGIPIFSVVKLDVIDGKVVIEKTIED